MKSKMLTRILGAVAAFSMAAGVGVAIGGAVAKEAVQVNAAGGTDTLNRTSTGVTGTSYAAWSNVSGTSGAVYAGQSAGGNSSIQLRDSSPSGIWTTTSGGVIKTVSVVWNSNTTSGRTLNIYGSNSPYSTQPSSTLVGTIVCGTSTSYSFSADYSYVAVKSNKSAMYLTSISFEWAAQSKTISSISTLPENGETIYVNANGATSVQETLMYEVSYSDGTSDSNASISGTGFTHTEDGNGNSTLTFNANGTYEVNIAADESHVSTVTYVVSGILTEEYQLYTGSIAKGDYVFMSADANYTYVMGNSVSANKVVNGTITPVVANNIITNPSDDYVWHIAKSGNYWTIQNVANGKYLAGTSTKNQATLLNDATSNMAKWTISYSGGWVFHNLGRSEASSDTDNAYLRNNTTSGWACYLSTTSNAPALFKLPSTDPAIEVAVAGETSLGVGETATLTATKVNGATGTVGWLSSDPSVLSVSSATGDSITVTGVSTGTATITASLTGCESVDTSFTVRNGTQTSPYTVVEARAAIDSGEGLVGAYTRGIISQVDSFSSTYKSITYWISDDGLTTSAQLEVYSGKDLDSGDFSSKDDLKVGDIVVVCGTLKKYNSTYEYDYNNYLTYFERPTVSLASITGIEGTLEANSGDDSWDLSSLVAKGTLTGSSEVVSVSLYVDLSTADVPGTVQSTTTRQVEVTVTPKDSSSEVSARSFNVSGTIVVYSGPIADGRYYIMHIDSEGVDCGMDPATSTSSSPLGVDISAANTLGVFNFAIDGANNTYTVTNDENKYLYATNDNKGVRIGSTNGDWFIEKISPEGDGEYEYYTMMFISNSRYLTSYVSDTANDFRCYTSIDSYIGVDRAGGGQHARLAIIPEGYYAETVAQSILDLTCDNGATRPSTSAWADIESSFEALTIANEISIMKNSSFSTTIANALAKYDYIVGKYGSDVFSDFLEREPAPITQGRIINLAESSEDKTMIGVIGALTIATIAAFSVITLKKRKSI